MKDNYTERNCTIVYALCSQDVLDNASTLIQIIYTVKRNFSVMYNAIAWYSSQGHIR